MIPLESALMKIYCWADEWPTGVIRSFMRPIKLKQAQVEIEKIKAQGKSETVEKYQDTDQIAAQSDAASLHERRAVIASGRQIGE